MWGDMVVFIDEYLPNQGKLSNWYLIPDYGDVIKLLISWWVFDLLVLYFIGSDYQGDTNGLVH